MRVRSSSDDRRLTVLIDRNQAAQAITQKQGRLLYWSPGHVESKRALPSTHLGLMARFVKESSMKARSELLPDIDFMDVQPRAENLACSGEPLMIQMPLVPCYAITVHKSQSLSIKHIVRGSIEGIFVTFLAM